MKIHTGNIYKSLQAGSSSDSTGEFYGFLSPSWALTGTLCVTPGEMLNIPLHYRKEGQEKHSPEYSAQK